MRFWITKPWPPEQIILLKWCCLLFGVAIGAWFGAALRPYAVGVFIAAMVLAVGPGVHYFRRDNHGIS